MITKNFLTNLFRRKKGPVRSGQAVETPPSYPCCSPQVHIAYRGVSDDRLYLSYDRQWVDVKFFRPHGLRVFCAICRKRVL